MKHTLLACALAALPIAAAATLNVYPKGRTNIPHNDDFTVKVRTIGGQWHDLFEYKVQVDMDRVQDASMVQFDMDEPVEVMVKKNNGDFSRVEVRPRQRGISATRTGDVVTFRLDKPEYLSVEFDGDRLHNLHLFANPVETETYTEGSKTVMYFGPGVHKPEDLPNNQIRIPSNTTVYLAPGAVVRAKLLVDHAENVKILGRGILDHPIRGIKFTAPCLNGGIDMMCCSHVDIENVFMRNSDDCIALYNHRWLWYGGSSDISVSRAVLWADIAHPINIGGHGDPDNEQGEVIESLKFKDIDILEHDEDDPPYRGCMSIVIGDNNIARNITFEDVRVENIQEGALFHIDIIFNPKYNKTPGKSISDITFRNISYTGYGESPSILMGYDETRLVENVTFDNVTINGQRLTSLEGFDTNKFVKNIRFK